jgi:hypothetical protein
LRYKRKIAHPEDDANTLGRINESACSTSLEVHEERGTIIAKALVDRFRKAFGTSFPTLPSLPCYFYFSLVYMKTP